MDTSEQYIKMCDCPEIQDRKIRNLYMKTFHTGDTRFYIANWDGGDIYFSRTYPQRNPQSDIWLPRQDQLQEKVWDKEEEDLAGILNHLADFYYSNTYTGDLGSIEQLWLAFVMWNLYQKRWEDNKWT